MASMIARWVKTKITVQVFNLLISLSPTSPIFLLNANSQNLTKIVLAKEIKCSIHSSENKKNRNKTRSNKLNEEIDSLLIIVYTIDQTLH